MRRAVGVCSRGPSSPAPWSLSPWLPAILLAALAWLLLAGAATAQTCRWDGTSPWCSGSCGADETEITRAATGLPDGGIPYTSGSPIFGGACLFGTKALCCKSSLSCYWSGTAPFCDGDCGDDTEAQPPAGSSSGRSCWTGSKKYCCRRGQGAGGVPISFARQRLTLGTIHTGVGKCLDVHAPDQAKNGARVQAWDCNGSPQQSWMLVDGMIRSHAGKCLDVHAPDLHKDGGRVQVWDCNQLPQQGWWLDGAALRSAGGKCLDVHAPDQTKNGARVQVWACNGQVQQRWRVQ